MSRRFLRRGLLLPATIAIVSLLAACSGQKTGSAPPVPPSSAPSSQAPAQPTQSGTIVLGAVASLTGPNAQVAEMVKMGVDLAVEEYNAKGVLVGGKPHTIKVVWGDSEAKVEAGLSVAQKQITVDKINIAVGYHESNIFGRAMDEYQKAKVPTVTCCSGASTIYGRIAKEKMDFIFQLSPTAEDIAIGVAEATNHYLKPKKIALLNENTDAGRDLGNVTANWFKKNAPSVEIVYNEYVNAGTTDLTAELSKIKRSGAEVVIGELPGAGGSAWVKQMHELKVPAFMSQMGNTTNAQDFIDKHSKEMEGTIISNRWWPGPYTQLSEPMIARFTAKYGKDPSNFAVQAYDTVLVAIEAVKLAGSLEPQKVRDALASGTFTAVWGEKKFLPLDQGQRVPTPTAVVQIQGGKKVPIWPLELATKAGSTFKTMPPYSWEK